MIIDLIRHGSPIGGKMYRGHSIDHPLSEQGWQQMRDSIGDYDQWDQIISSPMIRCSDFAQEVSHNHNIPLQIIDNLKEVGFGAWEGKNALDIDPKEFSDFLDYANKKIDSGNESWEIRYNIAGIYSVLGEQDMALLWIDRAIDLGWRALIPSKT